jgi:hypothetical protein
MHACVPWKGGARAVARAPIHLPTKLPSSNIFWALFRNRPLASAFVQNDSCESRRFLWGKKEVPFALSLSAIAPPPPA